MEYPTELVERAKFEVHLFERVSSDTGNDLIEEVERLRTIVATASLNNTHKCIACHHSYTPQLQETEDCPVCGCNGTLGWRPV